MDSVSKQTAANKLLENESLSYALKWAYKLFDKIRLKVEEHSTKAIASNKKNKNRIFLICYQENMPIIDEQLENLENDELRLINNIQSFIKVTDKVIESSKNIHQIIDTLKMDVKTRIDLLAEEKELILSQKWPEEYNYVTIVTPEFLSVVKESVEKLKEIMDPQDEEFDYFILELQSRLNQPHHTEQKNPDNTM